MDMSQYLEIFIEETKEHLQSLNQCLLQMEKDPEDALMLNEIFRVSHTLKGMSGTMGFTRMARLTHDMEDVLQSLRNNEIKASPKLIDLLFKCLDALDEYTTAIVETGSEGTNDNLPIIEELAKIITERGSGLTATSETTPASVASTAASDEADSGDMQESAPDIELNQYDLDIIEKASEMDNNTYQITVKLDKGCVLKSARAFIVFKTL